jgi:hypothetical protein
MPEFIVHDLITHGDLKRWLVFTNEDVIINYATVFGEQGVINLDKAIGFHKANFYEIKRYYQFIGIIKYTHDKALLTMSLFESNDMNSFLDAFQKLKIEKWSNNQLQHLGVITQQIIDDNKKELATINIKKLL